MPNIHISNWKSLKSSDFPRFKCLCELCDCGCFERANKIHTKICDKVKKRSGFEDIFDRNAATEESNYMVSFKEKKEKMLKPMRQHEPAGHIKLGDSSKPLPKSTFNDEYKVWDLHDKAQLVPEQPESTSKIIYPSNQRRHVTTNDELFLNNYGNFKAKQTAADMFLNSFQIDKNNYSKEKDEAKINTVYKKDFIKSSSSFGDSDLLNARSQIMTKEKFEKEKNFSVGKVKVPMEFQTNNMQDFLKFDNELYKNILRNKTTRLSANVFESSLRPGLKPNDDFNESNSIFSSRSSNRFDSGLTQNRRVSKDSALSKFTSPDFYSQSQNDMSGPTPDSTYKLDYKNIGVDLCMAKAFRRLENNIY